MAAPRWSSHVRHGDACLEVLARLVALAGSRGPSREPALLLRAADGPVIERLAPDEGFEDGSQVGGLATVSVAA